MIYLHAGGPLHGLMRPVSEGLSAYSWAEAKPISLASLSVDEYDTHINMGWVEIRYERTEVAMFGRTLKVYVVQGSESDKADRLFEVLVSSIAKAAIE